MSAYSTAQDEDQHRLVGGLQPLSSELSQEVYKMREDCALHVGRAQVHMYPEMGTEHLRDKIRTDA